MKRSKILIIGAGASGIAAASKLFQNGFRNVTILEAENRIGGRIHSVKLSNNNIIELGAQWCHGEDGNIVYDFVKDMNILKSSTNKYIHMDMYESNGQLIDKRLTDKLFDLYLEIEDDVEQSPHLKETSVGEYFTDRYEEKLDEIFGNNSNEKNIGKKMLHFFEKLLLCYDSAESWMDISLPGSCVYQKCNGDPLLNWGNKGYKTILNVLMEKSPLAINWMETILLNKEVKIINWKKNSNQCHVHCADGSSYMADHVIVTLPLGVLKANHEQIFEPSIPALKHEAIEGLGFGSINKILIRFSERWWPKDCKGFSFLWNKDDSNNLLNEFPYGPTFNGRCWLEDIFGFYVIDSDPNILMGWLVGPMAGQVEDMDDDLILNGCIMLLNKFLRNHYDISNAEEIVCSRWKSNPHFYGTYSYRSIESDKRQVYAKDLAEPISTQKGKPVVLFAGEATHSHYYSTVHGAIETGFREADRLANIYRNPNTIRRKCKVAIIGAGIAGLAAANTLMEHDIRDILIVEGSDRAGGRICTIEIDDGIIELGAQWLHSVTTPLYRLAEENNLISNRYSDEGLGLYVRDDGHVYDELLVKKVDFQIGRILEECERFVDESEFPQSVGNYLEARFMDYLDEECNDDDDDVKQMKWELYDWNVLFQMIDNSCDDLKLLSAKDWGKYMCLGKNGQRHMNIRYGYGSLIDILRNNLPTSSILYNQRVTEIDYTDANGIRLNCANDATVFADYVIVTCSMGVLKDETIFNPPLPQHARDIIQSSGFNSMGKVFLFFDRKWWSTEGFQLVWRRDTKFENCSENRWTRYVTGFDSVLGHDTALMGWVGGEGVAVMESLPDEVIGAHCVDLLKQFLRRNDIPRPIRIIKSTWSSNPLIKGAYSYTTTDCDSNGLSLSDLCDPVVVGERPRIWFAGESLHPTNFSTTHGAFESGQNQAKRLLKFL